MIILTDSNYALRPPRQKTHHGDVELRRMIAAYLKEIVRGGNLKTINSQLPDNLPLWGKVRITDGGDSIRSNMAKSKRKSERDMSYVRVSTLFFLRHSTSLKWCISLNSWYTMLTKYCMAAWKESSNAISRIIRHLEFSEEH